MAEALATYDRRPHKTSKLSERSSKAKFSVRPSPQGERDKDGQNLPQGIEGRVSNRGAEAPEVHRVEG
eukprot:606715-Lingulodinium_polyedra.AAC.1